MSAPLFDRALRAVLRLAARKPHTSIAKRRNKTYASILVEPSDFTFGNLGDFAMLSICIERLRHLEGDVRIDVLTEDDQAFSALFKDVDPLRSDGRALWLSDHFLPIELRDHVAPDLNRWVRRHAPENVSRLWHYTLREDAEAQHALDSYVFAVSRADLVVVSGMGGITDVFHEFASDLLDSLALAQRGGTPVVLMGQGIGPLDDPDLRERAATVLREAALICLREDGPSLELLRAFGVPEERILITGDEAIELAARRRPAAPGTGLGLNLRLAAYAGAGAEEARALGALVQPLLAELGAPAVSVPISFIRDEADTVAFAGLMEGYDGAQVPFAGPPTPDAVIDAVEACRLVITGSYHAAVFACASGIPALCLARSSYYRAKLEGLAGQFGPGCVVVDARAPGWEGQLAREARRLWTQAEALRPGLIAAADRQVAVQREAYARVADILAQARGDDEDEQA